MLNYMNQTQLEKMHKVKNTIYFKQLRDYENSQSQF